LRDTRRTLGSATKPNAAGISRLSAIDFELNLRTSVALFEASDATYT
jgi:hypothetical protein